MIGVLTRSARRSDENFQTKTKGDDTGGEGPKSSGDDAARG